MATHGQGRRGGHRWPRRRSCDEHVRALEALGLQLAASTYRDYERNVQLHVIPNLGRTSLRRLRYQQIESLYDSTLHPTEGRGLTPKTVHAVHLIIRGALADACRRGLVTRNVADVARAPKQRALHHVEGTSLTATELRALMRAAAGHRFFPIYWLTAMTEMRRNEALALKWPDIDFAKKRLRVCCRFREEYRPVPCPQDESKVKESCAMPALRWDRVHVVNGTQSDEPVFPSTPSTGRTIRSRSVTESAGWSISVRP